MSDTNMFGGKNAASLYVPMTEIEQEVVARLVESKELVLHIIDWGYIQNPRITFGDARVCIEFTMTFHKPEIPQPLYYMDLELRTQSGRLIFKDRQATMYNNQPVMVGGGVSLAMVWDIQIRAIDPVLVREVLPGTIGLTSRYQDKDTKGLTAHGNMRLNDHQKQVIDQIQRAEARWKQVDADKYQTAKRRERSGS